MLMAVVELRRNVNQVELEMFSQRASPLVSRLLIEESLPLCVVSLELNRRQPPKVQAKALILKTRKRHQQDPSMGSLLSPSIPTLVPGLIGRRLSPTHLNNKREPPVERSYHELVKITLLIG